MMGTGCPQYPHCCPLVARDVVAGSIQAMLLGKKLICESTGFGAGPR